MSNLAQLQQQVEQLAQQVAELQAQQVDQIAPNYITIDQNGKVSADFSGVIDAQGVTLPIYQTGVTVLDPPPDVNILQWLDTFDKEQVAFLGAAKVFALLPHYTTSAILAALLPDPEASAATAQIAAGTPADTQQAALEATYNSAGLASTKAIAGAETATVLDSNGNSSFVQASAGPRQLAVDAGQGTMVFNNQSSSTMLVNHRLGRTPIHVGLIVQNIGYGNLMCSWENGTPTTFQPGISNNSGGNLTLNVPFTWVAIG